MSLNFSSLGISISLLALLAGWHSYRIYVFFSFAPIASSNLTTSSKRQSSFEVHLCQCLTACWLDMQQLQG